MKNMQLLISYLLDITIVHNQLHEDIRIAWATCTDLTVTTPIF